MDLPEVGLGARIASTASLRLISELSVDAGMVKLKITFVGTKQDNITLRGDGNWSNEAVSKIPFTQLVVMLE